MTGFIVHRHIVDVALSWKLVLISNKWVFLLTKPCLTNHHTLDLHGMIGGWPQSAF